MKIISWNKSTISGMLILIFLLILITPVIWLETTSYDNLLALIIHKLNRPDLYPLFRNNLFTKDRYEQLYKFHWILYPIIIVIIIITIRLKKRLDKLLSFIYLTFIKYIKSLTSFFKSHNRNQRLVLLVFFVIYFLLSLYKILSRGITFDEAWNYNYFISKPPYFSFLLFNTYPLYHFIASVIDFIPFDPCITGRLISTITGAFFLLSMYVFTFKKYNFNIAILVLVILLATPLLIIFSAIIKGVILCVAISLIHFYATIQYIKCKSNKSYLFIYLISSFLNILSMPTAIIFSMATGIYIALQYLMLNKKEWEALFKIILYSTITIIISLLFYLPIICSSGKNKILGVENAGDYFGLFQSFFFITSKLFWGNKYVNIVLLLSGIIALLFSKSKSDKVTLGGSVFIIILSCIFFLFKKTEDRSIAFLLVPYLIIIIYLLNKVLMRINTKFRYAFTWSFYAVFILLVFPLYFYTYEFANPKGADKTLSKRISDVLMNNHVTTCYIQHADFWINCPEIEYYYSRKKQHWDMHNSQDWSTRYKVYSINDSYDCIITDTSNKFKIDSSYKIGLKENDFRIYFKNTVK